MEDSPGSDSGSEELVQRKRAWAELEREQDEVKRNIKSILKTAPESRVIENPLLADRVKYQPQKYEVGENKVDKETKSLKEQMHKEEQQKSKNPPAKPIESSQS